jgi:hypothetical protein
MTEKKSPNKFAALELYWWKECELAKDEKYDPLIAALRSDRPIPERELRYLRNIIAGALAGEFKRAGARKKDPFIKIQEGEPLRQALAYIKRFKSVMGKRRGRTHGLLNQAVAIASERFGIDKEKLINARRRSAQPRKSAPPRHKKRPKSRT